MAWAEYERVVSRVAAKVGAGIPGLQGGVIGAGRANLIEGASGFAHQIDVSVSGNGILLIAECKRWEKKVWPDAVLAFAARFLDIKDRVKNSEKVVAAIVTVKGLGPGAEQLAKHFGVELWIVDSEEDFVCRAAEHLVIGIGAKGGASCGGAADISVCYGQ